MSASGTICGDVVKLVDDLLVKVINQQASDVHFEPDDEFMLVRQRLDGVLHTIDRLPRGMSENVIARLKVLRRTPHLPNRHSPRGVVYLRR